MQVSLLSVLLLAAVLTAPAPEARPAAIAPHWQLFQDLWVNTTSWVQQSDGIWFADARPEPRLNQTTTDQQAPPPLMPTARLDQDPPVDLLEASGALTASELQRVKGGGGLRPLSLDPVSLRLACNEGALSARDCLESMMLRDPSQNQRLDDTFLAEQVAVNCSTNKVSRKAAQGWWSSWKVPQPDSGEAMVLQARCQSASG